MPHEQEGGFLLTSLWPSLGPRGLSVETREEGRGQGVKEAGRTRLGWSAVGDPSPLAPAFPIPLSPLIQPCKCFGDTQEGVVWAGPVLSWTCPPGVWPTGVLSLRPRVKQPGWGMKVIAACAGGCPAPSLRLPLQGVGLLNVMCVPGSCKPAGMCIHTHACLCVWRVPRSPQWATGEPGGSQGLPFAGGRASLPGWLLY